MHIYHNSNKERTVDPFFTLFRSKFMQRKYEIGSSKTSDGDPDLTNKMKKIQSLNSALFKRWMYVEASKRFSLKFEEI